MQHIKRELYKVCQEYVDKRIEASRAAIAEAQQSANEETKSSSGDKYETGRAMMQLEIEKNAGQLAESLKLKYALNEIAIDKPSDSVVSGSLVVTDREHFFIAISIGKVDCLGQSCLVISPGSPLGKKLIGLKSGDTVLFNNHLYEVKEVL
jgi:transcription elongation GreA/GreB family factor